MTRQIELEAMVNSLKAKDKVRLIVHRSNNDVVCEYGGKLCTAVYNPFTFCYYVDDVYGVIGEAE